MKLIVGLGNPGEKYEKTRHNLGFEVLDKFLKDFESVSKTVWEESKKLKAQIVKIEWQPKKGKLQDVILAKPNTFMNESGLAISLLCSFYKISPEEVLIVHDEIDLPLGKTKIRFGGGTAGHKGVTSVMEKLGTDKFWRLRLGIGSTLKGKKIKHADKIVLGKFGRSETGKARELVKKGAKTLEEILEHGFETAMNKFNTR
ncbi:MAG: aminoacyl-tRNA hydrolase [Patescibacteria group bacterium]